MRHQHRYGHGVKQGSRDTAEHKLERARMTVCAHHDQIRAQIRGERQNLVADINFFRFLLTNIYLDAVAREP